MNKKNSMSLQNNVVLKFSKVRSVISRESVARYATRLSRAINWHGELITQSDECTPTYRSI